MLTEIQQKQKIIDTIGCLMKDATMCSKLSAFIFSPVIWPRYRTAPASTALRYHRAYEGGLLDHSVEVARLGLSMASVVAEPVKVWVTDIIVVGLLHDLHKIGDAVGRPYFMPNMLKSGTRSDKIPYMANDHAHRFAVPESASAVPGMNTEHAQLTHLLNNYPEAWPDGELSLSLVFAYDPELFNLISEEAKFAIRHYAGMYDFKYRNDLPDKETPLMVIMHCADMLSSRREKWIEQLKPV